MKKLIKRAFFLLGVAFLCMTPISLLIDPTGGISLRYFTVACCCAMINHAIQPPVKDPTFWELLENAAFDVRVYLRFVILLLIASTVYQIKGMPFRFVDQAAMFVWAYVSVAITLYFQAPSPT